MAYVHPSRLPGAFAAAAASAVAVLLAAAAADALSNSSGVVPDMSFGPAILVGAFVVAVFHAILFGLPGHALLPRRWRYSFKVIAVGGFLVGGLPLPLLILLLSDGGGGALGLDYPVWLLANAVLLGLFGMVGGVVFWLIVREHAEGEEQ